MDSTLDPRLERSRASGSLLDPHRTPPRPVHGGVDTPRKAARALENKFEAAERATWTSERGCRHAAGEVHEVSGRGSRPANGGRGRPSRGSRRSFPVRAGSSGVSNRIFDGPAELGRVWRKRSGRCAGPLGAPSPPAAASTGPTEAPRGATKGGQPPGRTNRSRRRVPVTSPRPMPPKPTPPTAERRAPKRHSAPRGRAGWSRVVDGQVSSKAAPLRRSCRPLPGRRSRRSLGRRHLRRSTDCRRSRPG